MDKSFFLKQKTKCVPAFDFTPKKANFTHFHHQQLK